MSFCLFCHFLHPKINSSEPGFVFNGRRQGTAIGVAYPPGGGARSHSRVVSRGSSWKFPGEFFSGVRRNYYIVRAFGLGLLVNYSPVFVV